MIPLSCALCANVSDLNASNKKIGNTAVRKHRRVFMSFTLVHDELVGGFKLRRNSSLIDDNEFEAKR